MCARPSRLTNRGACNQGEVLTSNDMYIVIAPIMQTSAKKYDWLNGVQCIGKMVSYKNNSYFKYDIFVVR